MYGTATRKPKRPSGADYLQALAAEREASGIPDDCAVRRIQLGGTTVHIRRLTDEQRAAYAAWLDRRKRSPLDMGARLFAISACDPDGNLLFEPDEWVNLARSVPPMKLARLVDAICLFNGFKK